MSKDMLGSVVRAAVGVPQDRLNLLAKIGSKLALGQPQPRAEGEAWHAYLSQICDHGLPDEAYLIGVKATETVIGEFIVDYDIATEDKLRRVEGRGQIRAGDYLTYKPGLSAGQFHAVPRTGEVKYKASAVTFSKPLTWRVVNHWAMRERKKLGGAKEGVDMVIQLRPLKIAKMMPLMMFGDRLWDRFEYSYSPCFRENFGDLSLGFEKYETQRNNHTLWVSGWYFLMLEEMQSTGNVN